MWKQIISRIKSNWKNPMGQWKYIDDYNHIFTDELNIWNRQPIKGLYTIKQKTKFEKISIALIIHKHFQINKIPALNHETQWLFFKQWIA